MWRVYNTSPKIKILTSLASPVKLHVASFVNLTYSFLTHSNLLGPQPLLGFTTGHIALFPSKHSYLPCLFATSLACSLIAVLQAKQSIVCLHGHVKHLLTPQLRPHAISLLSQLNRVGQRIVTPGSRLRTSWLLCCCESGRHTR